MVYSRIFDNSKVLKTVLNISYKSVLRFILAVNSQHYVECTEYQCRNKEIVEITFSDINKLLPRWNISHFPIIGLVAGLRKCHRDTTIRHSLCGCHAEPVARNCNVWASDAIDDWTPRRPDQRTPRGGPPSRARNPSRLCGRTGIYNALFAFGGRFERVWQIYQRNKK